MRARQEGTMSQQIAIATSGYRSLPNHPSDDAPDFSLADCLDLATVSRAIEIVRGAIEALGALPVLNNEGRCIPCLPADTVVDLEDCVGDLETTYDVIWNGEHLVRGE